MGAEGRAMRRGTEVSEYQIVAPWRASSALDSFVAVRKSDRGQGAFYLLHRALSPSRTLAAWVERLTHAGPGHIVSVVDAFRSDHALCFVRPFVQGESLAALLAVERPLLARLEAAAVVASVAAELGQLAGGQPIGALGPDRWIIRYDDGGVCLVDPGVGARLAGSERRLGRGAPELRAGGALSARADVYALGTLLSELLARAPGTGRGRPTTLDRIAAQATSKRPERRFADPTALAGALHTFLAAQTREARPEDALQGVLQRGFAHRKAANDKLMARFQAAAHALVPRAEGLGGRASAVIPAGPGPETMDLIVQVQGTGAARSPVPRGTGPQSRPARSRAAAPKIQSAAVSASAQASARLGPGRVGWAALSGAVAAVVAGLSWIVAG